MKASITNEYFMLTYTHTLDELGHHGVREAAPLQPRGRHPLHGGEGEEPQAAFPMEVLKCKKH